jgi:acylphosphatase
MEDLTKHYLISGRVQGVGYRAFTHRTAAGMKLKGWVRNLNDGRVEAVAQGSEAKLQAFESQLREGPPHGHVETMTAEVWKPLSDLNDFEVRKDGHTPCSAP